jgi:hypothetical protein
MGFGGSVALRSDKEIAQLSINITCVLVHFGHMGFDILTSREFLYHLPCSSSARKLDSFGSGWLAPETAVRTDRVVVNPPAFYDDLGFFQRVE